MRTLFIILSISVLFLATACKKNGGTITGCISYIPLDSAGIRSNLTIGKWQLLYTKGGFTSDTTVHYPTQTSFLKFYTNGNVDIINNSTVMPQGKWTIQNMGLNTWKLLIDSSDYGLIGFCSGIMELDPQYRDLPKSVYMQIN